MSDKEILRAQVIQRLIEGRLSQKDAAERLDVTVRQVKRLKHGFLDAGVDSLVSKKRGQPSNRRIADSVLAQAMSLIGSRYADFGPTLAAEKLNELHGITLSVETVRKQMMAHGYWKARRGGAAKSHPMRERRSRRGELIQIDGSPHDWFEGRSPRCCLLVFIDDATGALTELQFVDAETTLGYMGALERHIRRHGVPLAIYSDRHSIFRINKKDVVGPTQTQFGRALEQLQIEGIHANSPQAKGRVERANQTLQDRLVKEMRLSGIDSPAQANAWLPGYMSAFNKRFAVPASSPHDVHVPYRGKTGELQRILSVHSSRTLSKNLSCQYDGQLLQVNTVSSGLSLRGAKVQLHAHQDGRTEMRWQGRTLSYQVLAKPLDGRQPDAVDGKQINDLVDAVLVKRGRTLPAAKHPWRNADKIRAHLGAVPKARFEQPKRGDISI